MRTLALRGAVTFSSVIRAPPRASVPFIRTAGNGRSRAGGGGAAGGAPTGAGGAGAGGAGAGGAGAGGAGAGRVGVGAGRGAAVTTGVNADSAVPWVGGT